MESRQVQNDLSTFASVLGGQNLVFDGIAEAYQGVAYERDENDQRIVAIDLASEADSTRVLEIVMERGEDGWRMVAFADLVGQIELLWRLPTVGLLSADSVAIQRIVDEAGPRR